MKKRLTIEYEPRNGITFKDLLNELNEDLSSCQTDEEREELLNSELTFTTTDLRGSIIYSNISTTIGQVSDDVYLIVGSTIDVNYHDEFVCPSCGSHRARRSNGGLCRWCKESKE